MSDAKFPDAGPFQGIADHIVAGIRADRAALTAAQARIGELEAVLRELVAVQHADPIRDPVFTTPGYRWYDAWQAARAALSAGSQP